MNGVTDMSPLPLMYINKELPAILLVPHVQYANPSYHRSYLIQLRSKFQSVVFNIVVESYCKRFYHDGVMTVPEATQWSQQMINVWHDEVDTQIMWELEEPPESNIQLGTDILYAYEHEPEILMRVIDELVRGANQSVLPFIDQFLTDLRATGGGAELRSVGFDNYNTAHIMFDIIPLDTVRLWQEQGYMYKGDRYALI